jgi:signal transduction histidine kinase
VVFFLPWLLLGSVYFAEWVLHRGARPIRRTSTGSGHRMALSGAGLRLVALGLLLMTAPLALADPLPEGHAPCPVTTQEEARKLADALSEQAAYQSAGECYEAAGEFALANRAFVKAVEPKSAATARQLSEQRDRMIQAERVAAWRELARRLAHELKNPLFPLQITVENLQRARQASPEQFEEVFRESTATLLAELDNLKTIIGRFSDFAKMPAPHLESVNLNDTLREVIKLFDAQIHAPGRPSIQVQLQTEQNLASVAADPEQIRRALRNLILNALDAMPKGGTLTLRTQNVNGAGASRVALEVSDTGEGLTPEECERLFTPYYTTKQHGTGLGLAIVQSVVSDHKGTISVHSQPGQGTTFRIELNG